MIEDREKAFSIGGLLGTIQAGKLTLDGTDLKVTSFFCVSENLTSLVGVPLTVKVHFVCNRNKLPSLIGGPSLVGGDYVCSNNKLSSLIGTAPYIGGHLECVNNEFISLKNIHKHIHEIKGNLYLTGNPIESHVLGLLKIKKLKSIELDNRKVEAIINKYLPEGDIFSCQQELIDAGLEAYAQL